MTRIGIGLGLGGGGGASASAPEPDYANPGGTGDRRELITVTTDGPVGFGFSGSGNDEAIIDGTANDDTWFPNNATGVWIDFDFGAPKVIDEAKWYQSATTTHGTWQWQGWDGDSWVNIGDTFVLGGAFIQTMETLHGNTTGYNIYRLLASPGQTSFDPFIRQIEFRIDDA